MRVRTKYNRACVLRAADIIELWTYLEEKGGEVHVSIDCADDGTRTFYDVKEITGYKNTPAKQITALHMASRSDDREADTDIRFERSDIGVSIDIDAEEQAASGIRAHITDTLSGTVPWYNCFYILARRPLVGAMVLILVALCLSFTVGVYFREGFPDFASMFSGEAVFTLTHLLHIAAGMVWIPIGLSWLKYWLFPPCYFAIGQGENRYQRLTYLHNTMLLVLITAIIGLLLVS